MSSAPVLCRNQEIRNKIRGLIGKGLSWCIIPAAQMIPDLRRVSLLTPSAGIDATIVRVSYYTAGASSTARGLLFRWQVWGFALAGKRLSQGPQIFREGRVQALMHELWNGRNRRRASRAPARRDRSCGLRPHGNRRIAATDQHEFIKSRAVRPLPSPKGMNCRQPKMRLERRRPYRAARLSAKCRILP